MTTPSIHSGQGLTIGSVPNLRDVGGYPTRDGGRVRTGLLYRSSELGKLRGDDMPAFARLGLRSIYDLRTEAERAAEPDRLPPGVEHIVLDVLKDSPDVVPAHLIEVLSKPKEAAEALGGGKAKALFQSAYREIVRLDSARAAYHRLFLDLNEAAHRPALMHCTTGKDRTGWAAAVLLQLLGVPDDEIMRDYLLTNTYLLPAFQPVFDRFAEAGGDPALLRPIIGVEPDYLEASLDEMHLRFGSFERYMAEGLGIPRDIQQSLRATFIANA